MEALREQRTFPIPSVAGGIGLEIPIIDAGAAGVAAAAHMATEAVTKAAEVPKAAPQWTPSEFEEDKAAALFNDINHMLQKEIDRIVAEDEPAAVEEASVEEVVQPEATVAEAAPEVEEELPVIAPIELEEPEVAEDPIGD